MKIKLEAEKSLGWRELDTEVDVSYNQFLIIQKIMELFKERFEHGTESFENYFSFYKNSKGQDVVSIHGVDYSDDSKFIMSDCTFDEHYQINGSEIKKIRGRRQDIYSDKFRNNFFLWAEVLHQFPKDFKSDAISFITEED